MTDAERASVVGWDNSALFAGLAVSNKQKKKNFENFQVGSFNFESPAWNVGRSK